MFTGIVTDLGRLRAIERRGDLRLVIDTAYDLATIPIGASIACSGPCLTVVAKAAGAFAVDVSAETLAHTTLGAWKIGQPVNLERPLRAMDELGGHIVTGHVDGVAEVTATRSEGDSLRVTLRLPEPLRRFVAAKGSVTLDGVSLTVNEVGIDTFGVNLIPHTRQVTSLGTLVVGSLVNVEIDILARYVARLTAA